MKKFRIALLLPALVLSLGLSPGSARADDEVDRIEALGAAHTYTMKTTGPASPIETGGAAMVVDAPIDEVRRIVTNYGSYKKFLKPFDQSRVLSKRKGVSEVYLQVPILHGAARIWVVAEMPPPVKRGTEELITTKFKRGNVDDFRATWRLRPVGDKTVLKLELLVDPALPFGASIVTQALTKSAAKGVKGVKERAEAAFAKRRPKRAAAKAPAPSAAPVAKPKPQPEERAEAEPAPAEAPKLPESEPAAPVKQQDVAKR